jgi:hypothetical protein
MAPRSDEITAEKRVSSQAELLKTDKRQPNEDKLQIVWRNVFIFTGLHLASLYGIYRTVFCKQETLIFCKIFESLFKRL